MRRTSFFFAFIILTFPLVSHGASLSPSMKVMLVSLLQKISIYSVAHSTSTSSSSAVTTTMIPFITSLNPFRGVSGTEITIRGKGFTASNTVHTIFESHYGIPSQKGGTELRFTHRYPPVTQSEEEALSILSNWGIDLSDEGSESTSSFSTASTQNVLLYIHNENGDSNVVTFIENLTP